MSSIYSCDMSFCSVYQINIFITTFLMPVLFHLCQRNEVYINQIYYLFVRVFQYFSTLILINVIDYLDLELK